MEDFSKKRLLETNGHGGVTQPFHLRGAAQTLKNYLILLPTPIETVASA